MLRSVSVSLALATLLVSGVAAAASYNENPTGDLSGDRNAPTSIPQLALGPNPITGTMVSGDLEYFTVTVPTGFRLTTIRVTDYVGVDGRSFIAVQAGSTFTAAPPAPPTSQLLGYSHFGPAVEPVGSDILADMGTGSGAQGFTGPLPAGNYTFWVQQTGSSSTGYTLTFDLAPTPAVPVPPVFAAALAAGLAFFGMRKLNGRARSR